MHQPVPIPPPQSKPALRNSPLSAAGLTRLGVVAIGLLLLWLAVYWATHVN